MDIGFLFTKVLAIVTLFGNAFILALFLAFFIARPMYEFIMRQMGRHALMLGFLLSLSGTVGSIVYSQVLGFPACILCWIQRLCMYPLLFVFGFALFRRENKEKYIMPSAMLLSLLGGAVALYQWVKDMLALYGGLTIPCPAVSALPSCDKIYVLEYGYITIPMIALNAFILIALVLYAGLKKPSHD